MTETDRPKDSNTQRKDVTKNIDVPGKSKPVDHINEKPAKDGEYKPSR